MQTNTDEKVVQPLQLHEHASPAGFPLAGPTTPDRIAVGDMVFSLPMDKISEAIVAAHGEIENVVAKETADVVGDRAKYSYKYADLAAILKLAKPILSKYGLALMQPPVSRYDEKGGYYIRVTPMLLHKSGQWCYAQGVEMKPASTTPQAAGSTITYCRRYSASPILGIASEDDDGAAGTQSALTGAAQQGRAQSAADTGKKTNGKEPAPGATQLRSMYQQARKVKPELPADIYEWCAANVEGYEKGKGLTEQQSWFMFNTFREMLTVDDGNPFPEQPPTDTNEELRASLLTPISDSQRQSIMILFRDKGYNTEAARHDFANQLIGKPSSKQWNVGDYTKIREALQAL